MSPPRGEISAGEAFKRTHNSEVSRERDHWAQQNALQRGERYAEVAGPLLQELEAAGVNVRRLSELTIENRAALPILQFRFPEVVGGFDVARDIIYRLAERWAQPDGGRWLINSAFPLLESVLPPPNLEAVVVHDLRHEIGWALQDNRDPMLLPGLVTIVEKRELGIVRSGFVAMLGNQRRSGQELEPLIGALLLQDEVWPEAARAAARLRLVGLRPVIEERVATASGWPRSQGRQAIRLFDRRDRAL